MKSGNGATLSQVYELVDKKIGEVNESIIRLETKFDILEAGRLSRLEGKVADLSGKMIATTAVIAFVITGFLQVALFIFKQ